jgi:hypothetical protein
VWTDTSSGDMPVMQVSFGIGCLFGWCVLVIIVVASTVDEHTDDHTSLVPWLVLCLPFVFLQFPSISE